VILAEGDTELAARSRLKLFLDERASGRPRVGLDVKPVDGPLTQRQVSVRTKMYLLDPQVLGVIALTDVCPGFASATAAKQQIREWMPDDGRCYAQAAQFQFESWLLCDWDAILRRAGVRRRPPGGDPEQVDGEKQPAEHISELFRLAGKKYIKPMDGKKLFDQLDLEAAARQCPELMEFLNSILSLAGYDPI